MNDTLITELNTPDVTRDVCADGTPAWRIESSCGDVSFIGADGATIIPTSWQPGPCSPPPFIVIRYRLAYDIVGSATPEVVTNVGGWTVQDLAVGDTVTFPPGWTSYQWYWEPETYPIPDPGNPGFVLLPTVVEDGRAYIAPVVGSAVFPQIQVVGEANDNGYTTAIHAVTLTAYSGAFIELRVTYPATPVIY